MLLWCARSGCDVGAHGAVVRRSLGWLGRSDHEIGFALVDRTPQKLEGEREYHGIQKKETFGYCRKWIVNWPPGARALTSKPRKEAVAGD